MIYLISYKDRNRFPVGRPDKYHGRDRMERRMFAVALVATSFALLAQPALAQTKLKFAHVYETNEPYHTEAVWAAGEIAKRTNNKYTMEVFPASALGNEPQINQALPLATVDIIYTGT